jgi:alpha-galactosidase
MAMLVWAISAATSVPVVGLCHSVQGTAAEAAAWLGVPPDEVVYLCAGINHMAFYLRLERQGQDLYPALRALAAAAGAPEYERVRFDVLRRWGYLVTESSEHFAEYVPWYMKANAPGLLDQFNIPLDEYPARCEDQIAEWTELEAALASPDPQNLERYDADRAGSLSGSARRRLAAVARERPAAAARLKSAWIEERAKRRKGFSGEYGAQIVHALETGSPTVIYGNVRNDGLIDNLPHGCCVEVPCLVDANGVQPTQVGSLPSHLAALMRTNIGVQELTVEAALTGNRHRVYQAAMLDPHTAAELDLATIEAMVDELLAAHGELIPAMAGSSQ